MEPMQPGIKYIQTSISYLQVCKTQTCKLTPCPTKNSDSDQLGWLTDSPQEIPMNKTRLFPSQACMVPKNMQWSNAGFFQNETLLFTQTQTHSPPCPLPASDWACPVWRHLQELLGRIAELWRKGEKYGVGLNLFKVPEDVILKWRSNTLLFLLSWFNSHKTHPC